MNEPQLSILIASTPSRWEMTQNLYGKLCDMAEGKDIEILLFLDNRKRSIGEKREALKNIANGKYIMWCDSDDELLSLDEIYEATFEDVDVITFKASCKNDDGSTYIVTQNLGNKVEHNSKNGRYLDMKRPPFTNCAWSRWFKKYPFPPINYSEDWEWVKQCLTEAKKEIHIPKILFKYNFSPDTTEASTESNEYWTNPNEKSNN